MAKEMTLTFNDKEAREMQAGLQARASELDGLFKKCMHSGMREAAEDVNKSIRLVREIDNRIKEAQSEK